MNGIQIRSARVDDLPQMQDIARRTVDACYRSFLGDESVDWFIDSGESDRELEKRLGDCDVLLKEGAIAAFTICFEDLVHLMMVDVRLHRAGIGSRLLAHAQNKLFAQGHKTIRLETFEGNDQAIRFYLKNGWSITRKERDEDHGFTRVFFEKDAQ